MQTSNPEIRVLIACPTLGLGISPDPNKWLLSLLSIVNQVRRAGCTYACFFPYRESWWNANNLIWDAALENKFDYILRIDDDIWNVPDDGFELLLAAKKDVIGAAYPNRHFPYFPCAVRRTNMDESLIAIAKNREGKKTLDYVLPDETTNLVRVDQIGFGMTLIKVAPFRYMPRPIFAGIEDVPDDTYFAQLCLDNRIQQFVHFGVKVNHAHVTWDNYGYLFNADVAATQQKLKKEETKENGNNQAQS